MRVGLVIYGSLATLSGGYLYDRQLVEHLRAMGDQVEIISLPWRSYPTHLAQNFSSALARRVAGLQVDLLLQDELNHPSLFLFNHRLRRQARFPLVSIVHHLRSSERHPPAARWLYRLVERSYLRTIDGFVFNSHTTQAAVAALLGRSVEGVVAYPGGDRFGEGLPPAVISERAREPGPLRLLFVGNVIPRKGLHTLLSALAGVSKSDWRLHVVGRTDVDPRYCAELQAFVQTHGLEDRVRFLGMLSEERLQAEWTVSHVLVVPSQYEGFGIVYLEGFSFGLPAVATDGGAAPEIITDGVDGFIVPPESPQELAAKLALLASDRVRLAGMSLAARRRFSAFPTWQQSAARIRAYLANDLLRSPAPHSIRTAL